MRVAGTKSLRWAPSRMDSALRRLSAALAVCAGISTAAAEQAPSRMSQIYQQRTPDGRIVLSDRPTPGVPIQRSWSIVGEDPVAARERSEKVRLEAQAVSERIQRALDLDRQRTDATEVERLRRSLAEARRDAEIAREAARETSVVYLPRWRSPQARMQPTRPPVRSDNGRPTHRPRGPEPGA
jgi:hypothetical protein